MDNLNIVLKDRSANSPQMLGWQQARTDLREFAELLVQREQAKEGLPIAVGNRKNRYRSLMRVSLRNIA